MSPSNTLLHHLVPLDYARATSLTAMYVPVPEDVAPRRKGPRRPRGPREQGLMLALIVVALIALGIALVTRFGVAGLQDKLIALDPFVAIAAMALLPLVGFSVAVVYVVAGAKFGVWIGGAVIIGITAVHLIGSHLIARSMLRGPLERWMHRRNRHLPAFPASENRAVAVMAALMPGLPYFARNYALALTSIPLRVYFWVCLPLYVIRSYVTLALGDLSRDGSREKLLWLVAIYVVKLSICAYLLQRLRRRLKGFHPTRDT